MRQFIKFCIVGGVCTVIDAAFFYILNGILGYRLAMIIGFVVSLGINYLLNIYWSFRKKPSLKNAICLVGAHCFNIFVVRMTLMYIFVDKMGMTQDLGYIPTLGISMITNFLIIRYLVNKV